MNNFIFSDSFRCINPEDIQFILNRDIIYSRKVYSIIKENLNKETFEPLTLGEFCNYLHLDKKDVAALFNNLFV